MEIETYLKGLSREGGKKPQNPSILVKDLLKAYCLKREGKKKKMCFDK